MSDANPDLKEIANNYRKHLTSELARVDAFIEMADRLLAEGTEEAFDPSLPSEKNRAIVLH